MAAVRLSCRHCGGAGFVHVVIEGREFVRRCVCRQPHDRPASADPFDLACIPPRYHRCTLASFAARTPTQSAAYSIAARYCERFAQERGATGLGLVFHGGPGTGKTHIAVAVLAELVATHRVRGRFWEFAALLNEITRSYGAIARSGASGPLESAIAADVLVLDDLGTRKMTDWADDTLFDVLNQRYMMCRPTLITTPYEDVDPETAREADAMQRMEFLTERIGARLRSRLREMCVFVPMETPAERKARKPPRKPSTLVGLRRLTEP